MEQAEQEEEQDPDQVYKKSRTEISCITCFDNTAMKSRCPKCSIPDKLYPTIVGMVRHHDGFAGAGIPSLALQRALGVLWNCGICLSLETTVTCEIDPTAKAIHDLLVPRVGHSGLTEFIAVENLGQYLNSMEPKYGYMVSMTDMVPTPV